MAKLVCPVCGKEVKSSQTGLVNLGLECCSECCEKVDLDSDKQKVLTLPELKEHLKYREENLRIFHGFTCEKDITFNGYRICVDETHRLWYVVSRGEEKDNPPIFKADEIVSFEITEMADDVTISQGGIGSAVAAGLLLGQGAAVVGHLNGRETVTSRVITSMFLRIRLDNPYHSIQKIEFIPPFHSIRIESDGYGSYRKQAEEVCALLENLHPASMEQEQDVAPAQQPSKADGEIEEILKYKQLLDAGILTEEEFTQKKKLILGI